jgi:hypothetical protein
MRVDPLVLVEEDERRELAYARTAPPTLLRQAQHEVPS